MIRVPHLRGRLAFVSLWLWVFGGGGMAFGTPRALEAQTVSPTLDAPWMATYSGSDHASAPRVRAAFLSGSISVDGRLDDPFWGQVPPFPELRQSVPLEGEPVSEVTEVRMAYDLEALYVGARLLDRSPVKTQLVRRDGNPGDSDLFVLLLDSFHDHETAYRFWTNPSGVKGDAIVTGNSTGSGDSSWDPVWEVATHVDEEGWSVEMRIPFSQLRFSSEPFPVWGIQVERWLHRLQERSSFPFIPTLERGGVARFAHLEGLEGIRPGRRLELLPYAALRGEYLARTPSASGTFDNPFRSGRDHFGEVGLDLKYRLSSNVTLDATVNPDFGQVELDPSVINLTAFETRYSERRPFFVEGADIFNFGEGGPTGSVGRGPDLLYSRRIGTAPRGRAPSGAVFSEAPDWTTILGAGKVTGRLPGGWSLGIIQAVTGQETANFQDGSGQRGTAVIEPLASYFVARARRQVQGGRTRFGVIASAVNRDPAGTPLVDRLHSEAYATGVDFAHESPSRSWILSGLYSRSLVRGDSLAILQTQRASRRYFQRPDADHLKLDSSATHLTGTYAMGYVGKQAGNFTMRNAVALISPGYEVNDLGFHTNADRILLDTHYQWSHREPGTFLRSWNVAGSPDAVWNTAGERTFANFNSQVNLEFMNYWRTFFRLQFDPKNTDDRLTRGGPKAQTPGGMDVRLNLNSDGRKRVVLGAGGGANRDDAGAWSRSAFTQVNVRFSETFQFRVIPSWSGSFNPVQYLTRVTDPLADRTFGARYVFAELRQTTASLETSFNLSLSPALSLQFYAEPFISTGDFEAPREFQTPGAFEFLEYGREVGEIRSEEDGSVWVDPDGAGPARGFLLPNRDFSVQSLLGNAVLRWEWRPGSTLFFVWQQQRSADPSEVAGRAGQFDLIRDTQEIFRSPTNHVLMVKLSYWFNP